MRSTGVRLTLSIDVSGRTNIIETNGIKDTVIPEHSEPPNVRIDVAFGKKWKAGREREKGSESTTNGRVSQSGSTKVSESGVAVGGGSGAGVGSIELVSLSMEQALW